VPKAWIDDAPQPKVLKEHAHLKDPLSYKLKKAVLGKPLNRHSLSHQRLSKTFALGILASDCISSSAYGSEQILLALLPAFGIAAFSILMPMTVVVLIVLVIVTFSYREVVQVYTRSGGAYVVSRDNLGPLFSQIAAVALMLDYTVTVAIQSSAGIDAILSTFTALQPYKVIMTLVVIGILTFGNLRGVKEAGAAFALPTYFFVISLTVMFITGIYRIMRGTLPKYDPSTLHGAVAIGHAQGLLSFAAIFILLRAFANGGSSLTGLEAISDGVSLFRTPEGVNARKTLVAMSVILGSMVFGVSYFAHRTFSTPYTSGSPTVISQVVKATMGSATFGTVWFYVVQAATMLILITGANTAFSGFPYLVNFVANDGFLPRQLSKRGHRLAFSNGIIVLAAGATTLVLVTGGSVNRLVAFYALGVFTGFSLVGFGMASKARRERTKGWAYRNIVNLLSGIVSACIIVIFAVVKFTEGAWVVLAITPILVYALNRLNRRYRLEQTALKVDAINTRAVTIARHEVTVLVDIVDLATIGAVRYARSVNPRSVSAVHFVLDDQHAEEIKKAWMLNPALADVAIEFIDCPDRRLPNAALDYAIRATTSPDVELTLLLPRRSYSSFVGRLMHDRTAEAIADPISQLPRVVATIIPFDVERIITGGQITVHEEHGTDLTEEIPAKSQTRRLDDEPITLEETSHYAENIHPIAAAQWRHRAHVTGHVTNIRNAPANSTPHVDIEIWDETGGITLQFIGRREITGLEVGSILCAEGMVGETDGNLVILNPSYEIIINHQ
jgi:amino acid transporter